MKEFIKQLGGTREVARVFGKTPNCIASWIYKGTPPLRGKMKLVELATAKGVPLPDGFLRDDFCMKHIPKPRNKYDAPVHVIMREFFNQLGGIKAIAESMGLQGQSVRRWIDRGSPSPWGKNMLALLAQEKGVALPDNFLSDDFGKGEQHD